MPHVLILTGRNCFDEPERFTVPFYQGSDDGEDVLPFPQPKSYREAGLWTPLKESKLKSLLLSYSEYFASCLELWPDFLRQYQRDPSAYLNEGGITSASIM